MRSMMFVLVVACFASVPNRAHADEPRFSMADLESLDKQESWQELLLHASDVPPSQRNDKWTQMLERAAVGVLASYQGEVDKAWTFADAVTHQYPQLKKSKRYMVQRAQVGVRGLEACLQQATPGPGNKPPKQDITVCADRSVAFAEVDPTDADTGFKLAKMIARSWPMMAVKVWKRALSIRHTDKDCSEELLGKSVAEALGLSPDDSRVPEAQAIASELCWDGTKDAVIDRFIADPSNKNFRKNSCGFLLTKKDALSPISKKQCEAIK
jgi:hypothetical protein